MQTTHVIGVDPGLVHTGVVRLHLDPHQHEILVGYEAVTGPDPKAVADWIYREEHRLVEPYIWIEDYRPRSHFNSDNRMVAAVNDMKRELGATALLNTGVKKVVKRPLMELFGVWNFSTVTHHQDLRAAARIALFGMLKHDGLNRVLTAVVKDHLAGRTWHVHH